MLEKCMRTQTPFQRKCWELALKCFSFRPWHNPKFDEKYSVKQIKYKSTLTSTPSLSLAGIRSVHGWQTKDRVRSPLLAAKYCDCVIPEE